MVLVIPPPDPVIVNVRLPDAPPLELVVTLSVELPSPPATDVGVNVAVALGGKPETLKLTLALKPFFGLKDTV